jgi:hypothetical protein
LARADEALVNFPPITLLRAERGLPNKRGEPVLSKWGNAAIGFSGRGQMDLYGASPRARRKMPPPGKVPRRAGKLELTTGGPISDARIRNIVRAIWKSTLELIYWDHGLTAYATVFDPIREAVIDSGSARGWTVIPRDCHAADDVTLEYQPQVVTNRRALAVRLSVFGVVFYTDPLRRDLRADEIEPRWPAGVWVF